MRLTAVTALLGLLAVQQAAAGGSDSDWQCSPGFPICSKSTNQCTNQQKGGINCGEESQPTSGSCSNVQGMGVQNGNYGTMKVLNKRSLFPRNGGSSSSHSDQKCVKQTCGTSKGSGITINKGSGSQYSCNAHHIVVEQPTVVQITHYNQNSGQTCSYHQMCNANEVTSINNDNCGQSDYHEVCVHPSSPSGPNVPIGVVGMSFNCVPGPQSSCSPPASSVPASSAPASSAPATNSTPVVVYSVTPSVSSPIESGTTSPFVSTPSPSVTPSSSPVVSQSSTPSPSVTPSGTSPVVTQSSIPSPSVTPSSSPVISQSSTPYSSVTPSGTSSIESGTTSPVISQSSTPSQPVTPSSPSASQSGTSSLVVSPSSTPSPSSPVESGTTTVPVETQTTSLTTYTTLTSCPVTSTAVVNGSTSVIVKTSLITSTITTCTRCVETPNSTPVVPPVNSLPASSSPAVPAPPAPTSTTPGTPQAAGSTSSVPSPPPVVVTSTPVVLTTTTEIVLTTVTTCPVTTTITPPHQPPTVVTTTTVSTVVSTSTSTITTTTLSPLTSSPGSVVPGQSPSAPAPVAPPAQPSPPPAFKGCISAYFDLKGCGSNTDYDCYCKQDEVTTKVFECITNYEQDVAKQAAAMASYQGLCAQYVPQHPVIITKSVQLIPTPVSTPVGSSPAVVIPPAGSGAVVVPAGSSAVVVPAGSSQVVVATPAGSVTPFVPVPAGQTTTTTAPILGSPAPTAAPSSNGPSTTIPFSATITIPCSAVAGLVNQITDGQVQEQATSAMASGCTTTSLFSTQLAVPQIHFATSGTSVGLAAGTPAANQAGATALPTAPAAPAPVPGVAGVAGASGTASVPASTTPATFHGAAAKTSHSGVLLSVVLAAVGLVVYA